MANRNTLSASAPAANKMRAMQEADVQQQMINEKVKRLGLPQPDYQFKELIGKGSYGRVYKSLSLESNSIVAVKVLETDAMDFDMKGPNKDIGMSDALKEIEVLQRLQQSKAVNVNLFHDAFPVHSQLWIVSEYCPGGSLTTLRRASSNRLTERHIIPIARELALGLKSVHAAGIVHRDIKSSNVMISESGKVQIIDFGVAGILLSSLEVDKRKTVIGTPHWMPPEMQQNASEIAHGTEVDVWAYGITLYECATGAPPNARTMPGRQLKSQIRQNPAPRLSDDRFSEGLNDLIAQVLEPDPLRRPRMDQICQEPYLADSEEEYPTSSLRELVENYYLWEASGGQRASLFMQGGAVQPKLLSVEDDEDEDDWNFSTTANFEKVQNREIDRLSMSGNFKFGGDDFADMLSSSPPTDLDDEPFDQLTARYDLDDAFADDDKPTSNKGQSDSEVEGRIARGARAMQGLFDESSSPYKYHHGQKSDLPLRSGESGSFLHRKELSVSSQNGNGTPQINLSNIPKKGGKRQTMNWKWDDNVVASGGSDAQPNMPPPQMKAPDMSIPHLIAPEMSIPGIPDPSPTRPQLKHSVTMPIGSDRPMSETLDLDALLGDSFTMPRPQQAQPSWSDPLEQGSFSGGPAADPGYTTGDESDAFDPGFTLRPAAPGTTSNLTPHNYNNTQSSYLPDPVSFNTETSNSSNNTARPLGASPPFPASRAPRHSAHPSYASSSLQPNDNFTPSRPYSPFDAISTARLAALSAQTRAAFTEVGVTPPVDPAALAEGASQETVLVALERGLGGWMEALEKLEAEFGEDSDTDDDDDDYDVAEGGPGSGSGDEGYGGEEDEEESTEGESGGEI